MLPAAGVRLAVEQLGDGCDARTDVLGSRFASWG